jgi:HK97 family phage major capsid protein
MTKAELQALLDAQFKPLEEAVRKSRGTGGTETDRAPASKEFSISKYLRGVTKGIWTDAEFEKEQFELNKVMTVGTGTAGGFLATPEYDREVIELLRAGAAVRSLGPRIYPMSGNTMFFTRQSGAATAYWVAEGAEKTESNLTLGQNSLVLKEVAGLVRVTNDLLEDASPAVDALIKQDLVQVLTLAEDLAFIQGTGGAQPLGIYNDPAVPNTTLGGGNGAQPTYDDLMDAMYAIEAANAQYTGWLMHPRTKNTLRKLKDGNGQYIYEMGDMVKGIPDQLLGLPVAFSTQIPITLTFGASAATCSYLILGDWKQLAIGEKAGRGIVFDVSTERYFDLDQTAIRAVRRIDCMVRQPNAFYCVRGLLA